MATPDKEVVEHVRHDSMLNVEVHARNETSFGVRTKAVLWVQSITCVAISSVQFCLLLAFINQPFTRSVTKSATRPLDDNQTSSGDHSS